MYGKMKEHLSNTIAEIKEAGLYKEERLIESAQQAAITVKGKEVLNFCANNYLGLSNHPRLIEGAKKMMDRRGYGMSSVRFICGTQDIHKELEAAISDYFKTEDTILYAACFDANGGVFEPLFTDEDAIISDSLNHASIIDGVRLCKAKRYRYANADMGRPGTLPGRKHRLNVSASSSPTVYSQWTETLLRWTKSVTWPKKYECPGDGRRISLSRCGWCNRSWSKRTVQHLRTCRHLHRYSGQSFWRCFGRIHNRPQRDHRPASPAQPSVPVLQLTRYRALSVPASKYSRC